MLNMFQKLLGENGKDKEIVRRWLTRRHKSPRTYRVKWKNGRVEQRTIDNHSNHEDITIKALDELKAAGFRYGKRARKWLIYGSQYPDEIKPEHKKYERGEKIDEKRVWKEIQIKNAVNLFHAYHILKNKPKIWAQVHRLRNLALKELKKGYEEHALRLLGFSLHTIQDYYAHFRPISDPTVIESDPKNKIGYLLHDDPKLHKKSVTAWNNAIKKTKIQLKTFYAGLNPSLKRMIAK